jgi:hypothetical protein
MSDISFGELSRAFGRRAATQLFLAGVLIIFRDRLCKAGDIHCAGLMFALASLLLAAGVIDALLTIYLPNLRVVAVRGIFDGLLAGIIAGIFAGFLGFGRHPMTANDYRDPQLYRVFRIFVFTVPTAALLGACLGFLRPETPVNWRRDLSPAVSLLLGTFLVIPWVLAIEITKQDAKGHGIEVGDIQIIFECFLIVYTGLYAFAVKWTAKQICQATAALVAAMAFAEAGTRLARWPGNESSDGSVYHLRFFDPDGVKYFIVTGVIGLCMTAIIFAVVVWMVRSHPVTATSDTPRTRI